MPETDSNPSDDPAPVKLERIVPRILRPKEWRRQKFTEVRFDQTRQRFDRIRAHYHAYSDDLPKDKTVELFLRKIEEVTALLADCRKPLRPLNPFALGKWKQYRVDCGIFESKAKEISAAVHELHVLFVKCAPFYLVEAGIGLALFDLKIIASQELYEKARRGLERYESEWASALSTQGNNDDQQNGKNGENFIRARCIILVQETRRQSLALAQLEVLRDAVATEILVAATRLSIMLLLILGGTRIFHIEPTMQPSITAAVICAQGGVLGAVISSIIRVGKMQDNLDASRALVLISGASRSIYLVPMIGCLSAVVLYAFAISKFDLGVINFDLFEKDESMCDLACPPAFIIRAFILGIISGFSERLVHDLVDRFNKRPTK